MAGNSNWYDDPTILRGFAAALTAANVLESQEEFSGFFNFPQRYNEFYEAWEENDFPDPENEKWDDFVDAVTVSDDDDDDSDGDTDGETG